ncbi:disease resistance protein Roq1-like isoform X2 [Nymphaea colorata]|uniref:disease resistance protein Roq1-like isoform X2 n=1 Tax=Nymphaea colorata TaxID=210225 RepID=UPI00129E2D43|nr:disease resistance protein Roq1-like isoform X2 [Nymphaea colorata]
MAPCLRAPNPESGPPTRFPVRKNMELPFHAGEMRRDVNHGKEVEAAEPSSSSSPPQTGNRPSFNVFLSFRGEDTRKGFTGHLYNALRQHGISTFIDSEELERGERIEDLFSYIEGSQIFVPVLSKGYTNSRWCLREITKMVECGRLILPIFFDVDPTHVRNQSGPFEAAFQRHAGNNRVGEEDLRRWKDALRAVGEIRGHCLQNDTNGLLDLTDNEVKMIGIVGMGGIGKTTIASVVHNRLLSDFEDSSFISDVREGFKQHNGGVTLQRKLIKHILKDEHSDIYSVKHGASLIRARLCFKRVLVILDDTDHIEQLEALAGERDWFGPGSRIIITSRDSRLLLNHGVKEKHIYRPELLDDENSFKLFNSHAFRGIRPTKSEYHELSMEVVKVTGGLPLALTVFGSLLRGRNIKQWKETLQKLLQVPNMDIDGRLRISYEGLEENVKQIFLDISCFFIGEQKEDATYMWEDCGLHPQTAITELQERSIIRINEDDEFEMHDLVRDMGRRIAQQGEPWHRSRLRDSDDLLDTLVYKAEPMAEGIVIMGDQEGLVVTPRCESEAHLSTEDFVDLSRLRFLHLSRFTFKGEFLRLPRRLKWLRLLNCDFVNRLSGSSNLNDISVLELIHADVVARVLVEQSSSGRKVFNLKVLHLESFLMTRTPDFSKMKMICLRKLTLRNCKMLTEVDGSIRSLKSLVYLDLRHCSTLQRLPDSICTLNSLQTLLLIGCFSLSSLPEKLGNMQSLRELWAEYTGIHALPDSIGDLSNLRTLSLKGSYLLERLPDSMRTLESLEELYIDHFAQCLVDDSTHHTLNLMNLGSVLAIASAASAEWLAALPSSSCEKVKKLKLSDETIQELPPYLGRLKNLEALSIDCHNLRALPEWLGQLQKLNSFELESDRIISTGEGLALTATIEELSIRCPSLEALPATAETFANLRSLELHCPKLKRVSDWIASLGSLEKLSVTGRRKDIKILRTSPAHLVGRSRYLDQYIIPPTSVSTLALLTSSMAARGCSVRTLNLSCTKISGLPSSMGNLAQLEKLHLEGCENLQSLPPLPSSLHVLNARDCNNLRTISDVSTLKSLRKLKLSGCRLLGDFCGLESIAHNLETLELPGPCGGLSRFSQLSPVFMTRVFKEAAFSSLKTFSSSATNLPFPVELIRDRPDHSLLFTFPDHSLWFTFPKVGKGGKRPTRVVWSSELDSMPGEASSISISIVEEDGRVIHQYTQKYACEGAWYHDIGGEAIVGYSKEGYYLRMQVSSPSSNLNEIMLSLHRASLDVRYT